jgi:hypothetical protein
MPDNQPYGDGDTLPAELESLHLRLLADGDDWRAEFPPSAGFLRHVEAFGRTPAEAETHAQQRASILPAASERARGAMAPDLGGTVRGAPSRRSGRRRGFTAVAVAATVAALFAVVFQMLPTNGPRLTGTWQTVGQFQAHAGEGVVVARSDPRVVYRINHSTLALERSSDGGATWHTLEVPDEVRRSPVKPSVVLDVSPLAANTVYLTAYVSYSPSNCAGLYSATGQGKRDPYCSVQYVSTDGGARWRRLMLPENGRLTGMLIQVNGIPYAPLLPQEGRVYSLMTVDDVGGQYRLVASDDGVNWRTVDDELAATGLRIGGNVSYVATPTGSTIWVRTSDGATWRSDDAGASWEPASGVPRDATLAAAARTADGTSLLYVEKGSQPLGDVAPADVRVSADGGVTWEPAPARGVPNGQHATPHSAMVRADGTLVLLFRTARVQLPFPEGMLGDAAFYAWKPGAKAWTRLTPTFDAQALEQQWIASAAAGSPETIWGLVYRDDNLTYDGEAYIKDGMYTTASCALGS